MKKIFGFRSKGPSPLGPSASPRNNCVGFGHESAGGSHMPKYHIHDKDMGKIHKSASVGDVAKVQHILILGKSGVNDRDKKDRVAHVDNFILQDVTAPHQESLKAQPSSLPNCSILFLQIEDLTSKLETLSSKCLHLDKKNQCLQQELLLMKTVQRKCVKLEKNKKELEEEVVSLRSHMARTLVEQSELQQYKQAVEERARLDLVEKLKQVNLFLQAQAASQENLEQLREKSNASVRSQLELRIKDLESQLSRKKTQEDFDKIELEKYKQLYQEEFRIRKSLSSKLNK
ncbi:ankyrin repeat domain-containing protein 26-like [Onychomys torridus]|uniref:ankyrin repeat domain-containing protein 26-like n=1 Tax=Onychomys torridus TaxID=38674 RepID=UPI00167F34DE|nr:ankyrin repeat domain-containing protein 26-like [Onychomys torridus]